MHGSSDDPRWSHSTEVAPASRRTGGGGGFERRAAALLAVLIALLGVIALRPAVSGAQTGFAT